MRFIKLERLKAHTDGYGSSFKSHGRVRKVTRIDERETDEEASRSFKIQKKMDR
jgi:hypothetical protein